jgi:tetratricopeptide (TPR) repeat protein
MANIIDFPAKNKIKSGLKKVQRSKEIYLMRSSQTDMFSPSSTEPNVYILPTNLSPFEEALVLDETRDEKTEEAYRKAILSNDCVADAYCNLGILEYEAGRTVKAIDCFTNSLKHEPRHFESHYNLANLYSEIGNLSLAKYHYEFAKELQPGFPDVYFNLGLVYAMTKDFESAVKVLLRYKEMVSGEDSNNAEKLIETLKKSLSA